MGEANTAQTLKEDGLRLWEEGLYEEAAAKFEQAQEQFAAQGDELEAAEMVNNLGVIHRVLGRWDEAIAALDEARAAFARLGDRNREAQALGNLGGTYASRGERDKAQEYLRQAADIFGELGEKQLQGETLQALGVQQWKAGDRSAALATYQSGLQTLKKPSIKDRIVGSLLNLRSKLVGD